MLKDTSALTNVYVLYVLCLSCGNRVCVCMSDLHALYGVGHQAGSVDEVSVFHVFCDSLQEAQRLVEDDGHRDL